MAKKKSPFQQLNGQQTKQYAAFQQLKQNQGGIVASRNPFSQQTAQSIMTENAKDAQSLMSRIAKRNKKVR